MRFYTYLWLRYDGTPYYAGKGTSNRAFYKHHRHFYSPPDRSRIILEYFETEAEAFEAEIFLIAYYRRKNIGTGCLWNISAGGEGPIGLKRAPRTAEHRRKLGEAHKGKPAWNKGLKGAQVAWNKGLGMPPKQKKEARRQANQRWMEKKRVQSICS